MNAQLNLLSPEKKSVLRTGFIVAYVQTMLFLMFIVVAFASGTLLAVRMMFKGTHDDLASRSSGEPDESKVVTADIKKINDYLKRIDGLEQRFVPWSRVLEEITGYIPKGTKLSSLRIDQAGKIYVSGIAKDREDVISLQSRLEGSKTFVEIKAPLSNILQQTDVKFDFEMKYALAPAPAPAPSAAKK
ncbi:MAG TPA: PilN domain-containing protein [Candidatus Eisenbacteria bacterium]|nr:PilN domain-containing protein [Candidatus Eisenbacteria bacterium]